MNKIITLKTKTQKMKKIMLIACLAAFMFACNNSAKVEDKLPATDSTTIKLDSLNKADTVKVDTVKKIDVKEKK